jgi:phosphoglycerate dehydrogenase-like enzyme
VSTRTLVLDLSDARPIWRLPAAVVTRIAAALPADWRLVVVESLADGRGDGAGPSADALAAVADAEVYMGYGISPEILRAGPRLRWIHSGAAGVGASLTPELLERDILFTNSAGVHAEPMAETVLAMVLHFARGLDHALRAQAAGRWDATVFEAADAPVREIGGSTVGIIGLGGIGGAVAWRVAALGARVLAVKRRPAGSLPGVTLLQGDEGLPRLLAESHYVVVSVPDTPKTRGLLDGAALDRMRADAVLVNVARGRIVDEVALVERLRTGRIRGAALDVFAREPLPADHPLWRLPNVLITPHVSGCSHHFWDRECALILENLRRYLSGEALANVVDKGAGY